MVRVITVNNFKGGVSKTSTTNGIAYTLSEKMNFKTLVIDIDPQADATDTLLMTFNGNVKNSLYETFENNLNVQDCIVGLSKNLDLIPSDFNMIGFPQLLDDLGYSRTNGATILSKLINEIKYNYDYILIDTPQQ